MHNYFDYSAEIEDAITNRQPILALESTLITHGLPYPENIETALHLEKIVRQAGAVPATIAVMDKQIKIGMTTAELERLVKEKNVIKVSRRDLPFALNHGLTAGTTVAATLFCAYNAGIRVFATGGIGGVHRGDAMDISADLIELSRTPIAIVCSGAKAILDIPRTLEYLETYSIPIVGFQTHFFPAFYTALTKYRLPASVRTVKELVSLLKTYWTLDLPGSMIIANPIPQDDEIAAEAIEPAIAEALTLASKQAVRGKAITPFLLKEIANATQGKSLKANLKLIENNVRLGAEIACQL